MDTTLALPLLGGLSPRAFMRRHWQKRPLRVRGALPGAEAILDRARLFELAADDAVESRLVVRDGDTWKLRHGPLGRRALPPLSRPGWSLLVQDVQAHVPTARRLLDRFRFVPDARLDDLMVSFASDGGGVGPHVDSYDVFLLQLRGRRRWRVGPVDDPSWVEGAPLKLLARFAPVDEWLLDAGDMLYLPPGWGHDGVAEGECLTASIGFRAPARDAFGREILQRALDAADPDDAGPLYRDPAQPATDAPGRLPEALAGFGAAAVSRLLADRKALACAVGEVLSEPKPGVVFSRPAERPGLDAGVRLAAATRMLYDDRFVFLNGESFRAGGRDLRLMRELADRRLLGASVMRRLSAGALELVEGWAAAGWLVVGAEAEAEDTPT